MSEWASFLRGLFTNLKAPPSWVLFCGILIFTCWYVLNPWGADKIKLKDSEIILEMPVFRTVELHFSDSVFASHCDIGKPRAFNAPSAAVSSGDRILIEKASPKLCISNSLASAVDSSPYVVQDLTVQLKSADHVEIVTALIDGVEQDLAKFSGAHLKGEWQMNHEQFLRKMLAAKLAPLNDKLSNWVLTFMFFGVIYVCARVLLLEFWVYGIYVFKRSFFLERLIKLSNETDLGREAAKERAKNWCSEKWARRDAACKFLQALGPAAGFILTVSSLIYALATPKVDVEHLISGMHIAMVSTFLGLFLRIVALEGERVSLELFSREFAEIENAKPSLSEEK